MKIRSVYLAGGINGLSDSDANDWRAEAKRLLPREIGVLDPMSRDYRGKEAENVKAIVDGDLADINSCDAIVAYCPRASWGTAMEIHYASTTGKYVAAGVGDKRVTLGMRLIVAIVPEGTPVSPWLRHHADVVVGTLQEAVDAVVTA